MHSGERGCWWSRVRVGWGGGCGVFFFFNDPATTEIYTLSLHDALPICPEAGSRQVLEPLAAFIVSPYGGNPNDIPNEDSQNFEFDDTNIFSTNRFPGLDRIEGGPRLNYGLRYGLYANNGGSLTALIGQTLRLKADDTFAAQTGLENPRSDFVGRIDLSPSPFVSFYNRFRLDRHTLSLRPNEITPAFRPPAYPPTLPPLTPSAERRVW